MKRSKGHIIITFNLFVGKNGKFTVLGCLESLSSKSLFL